MSRSVIFRALGWGGLMMVDRDQAMAGTSIGLVGKDLLRDFLGVAFERSALAMFLVDGAEQIRCANAAASIMLATDDLVGRSVTDFRVPEPNPQRELDAAALVGGGLEELERGAEILSDSGRRLRVMMRVDAVTPPSGQRSYLVQLRDVTTAVEQAEARAEGEMQYRQLVSNLPGMSVLMFDRDLRVLMAGGEVLDRGRYDPETMAGQLLEDVFPVKVMALLEAPYRASLDGEQSDFDYTSPVDGRQYRMRLRPVPGTDGTIIGGLALSEDVTAERARQTLLEQVQKLNNVGTICYDILGGWVVDDELLTLLGVDSTADVQQAMDNLVLGVDSTADVQQGMDNLVLPEDRAPTRAAYHAVLAAGGQTTLQYRLVHGKTGQLRHMIGTIQAVVDSDGKLLRALATHADVTQAVQAQSVKVAAARARSLLLRLISDALAQETGSLLDTEQSTIEVATVALGDGAILRILTADGRAVETDLVSDSDEQVVERMTCWLRDSARSFDSGPRPIDASPAGDELWSSMQNVNWRSEFEDLVGHQIDPAFEHFISAPVRHDGIVLGYLRLYRTDRDMPYQVGDDDLIQVLADRIGSAVADSRARELLEQQLTERRAIVNRLQEMTFEQRELVEQLATVEDRERTLLAEAIHDGPLQLVIAAMMRLELGLGGETVDEQELEQVIDTLEMSVTRLRTLIVALTPPDLGHGLGVALRNLAQGIFVGTTTEIAVTGAAHVSLSPLRTGNAYRILREALVNIRKHAKARHVSLLLEEGAGTVTARLTDDGVGATNLDAGPGHLGIPTMRARADAEGGCLDITSAPGEGTTVILNLPTDSTNHLANADQ